MANDNSSTQLGYLTGRVESLETKVDYHIANGERLIASLEGKLDKMSASIDYNSEQLNMYRHLIFFVRTLAVCLAALLAANWSDVKEAWFSLFTPLPK
jgi:hypothetical protein